MHRCKTIFLFLLCFSALPIPLWSDSEQVIRKWDMWHLDLDDERSALMSSLRRHRTTIKEIKWNPIGFKRINQARRQANLTALPNSGQAPFGSEIIVKKEKEKAEVPIVKVLPKAVNNAQLQCFPPIASQGNLGSCAAFSIVYYQATHMLGLYRNWKQGKREAGINTLSPKFVYNMFNGGNAGGVWPYDVYRLLLAHGCCLQRHFKYVGDKNQKKHYQEWCTDAAIWRKALTNRFRRAGQTKGLISTRGLNEAKQLLVNGWVLQFSSPIDYWDIRPAKEHNNEFKYAHGLYNGKSFKERIKEVKEYRKGSHLFCYHSMTIVGYDDTLKFDLNENGKIEEKEKGAFLVANSWGTDWKRGNKGFMWAPYGVLNDKFAVPKKYRKLVYGTMRFFLRDSGLTWLQPETKPYKPKVVAEIAFNNKQRNQVRLALGVGKLGESRPERLSMPAAVNYLGGAIAVEARLVLDFSEVALFINKPTRYFLCVFDNSDGNQTTVTDFIVADEEKGKVIECKGQLPIIVDQNKGWASIDYDRTTGQHWANPYEAKVYRLSKEIEIVKALYKRRLAVYKKRKTSNARRQKMKKKLIEMKQELKEKLRKLKNFRLAAKQWADDHQGLISGHQSQQRR